MSAVARPGPRAIDRVLEWIRRSRHTPTLAAGRAWDRPAHLSPARHPDVTRVRRELARLGLRPRLRFLWAHDGSGVEPHEPDVIHLDRSLRRTAGAPAWVRAAADTILALGVREVARHEVGHALLFARPRSARARGFRRLFGDAGKAYRVGDPVAEVTRRIRRHDALRNPRYRRLVSIYAATHPHEAFAEAFRIALTLGGDRRAIAAWVAARGKHPIVRAQIEFAAAWLRRLAAARARARP